MSDAVPQAVHVVDNPWKRYGKDRLHVSLARDAVDIVDTEERAWRVDAEGEQLVGGQLRKLAKADQRWRFLHAVPVVRRGSDIDHVIIGPGGVFTARAKHHTDARIWVGDNSLLVNGSRTTYLRNTRQEAGRASALLTAATGFTVHVQGLVVTVNASSFVMKSQPDGVSVTWRKNLAKFLLSHGEILSAEEIEAIYTAARRSTTWS